MKPSDHPWAVIDGSERRGQWVYPPLPAGHTNEVQRVWLEPGETVTWLWSSSGSKLWVSGYTIHKQAD